MEIQVLHGEWMQSLSTRMDHAVEGDCFLLPSPIHLHAFQLVKDAQFPGKNFIVRVRQEEVA